MKRFALALAAFAVLGACTGPQLLNMTAINSGKIERDISYGSLPRNKLDVYSPKSLSADTPVLVFYHGGSWKFGSKDDYKFLGTALAARGIQTVVVNYRLYPDAIFPAFVQDAAEALVYTKNSIAKDRPIFIAGHSAGAHIAAMVDLAPEFLAAGGTTICDTVKGFIGISGPYDFTPKEEVFKKIFPAEILPSTKPIYFASNSSPPVLLLHGTKDDTVDPKRTTDLATALTAAGTSATVKMYDGVDHLYIIGAISPLVRGTAPTLNDITGFIAAQKAAGYPGCSKT